MCRVGEACGLPHTALIVAPENLTGGNAICSVAPEGRITTQDHANARLIAAAPCLLEACEAIEAWWLETGQHGQLGAPAAVFMARAAVAKATGQNGGAL